jgi:hypothetical protein
MIRTVIKKFSMAVITLTLLAAPLYASQSSANYRIESNVISGGGGDALSTNYYIEHTTGQSSATGDSSSANYVNYAGFWYTIVSGTVSVLIGDMNEDGVVDISDVIRVLRMALNLDASLPCANINGDGIVDIADVILTLRMALGLDLLKECI